MTTGLLQSVLLLFCCLPLPALVAVWSLLFGAGECADVNLTGKPPWQDEEKASKQFDVVALYRDGVRGNRDDDVILIERDENGRTRVVREMEERGRREERRRRRRERGRGGIPERGERGGRDRRQASTANRVELLLTLDLSAFLRFLTRNNNNATAARQEIDRYFAGVVRSVNARLAKLDTASFAVRVILTEVYILTLAESTAVTDSLNVNNDGRINADVALVRYTALANNTLRPVRPHDYTLLVTGYDLRRANGNDAVGITYQSAVCSDRNQGLVEEEGDEMISATMAHEIGHTLGALHDQQQNDCPNAFFTMAPAAGVPSLRSQSANPFTFSNCSISEMTAFVGTTEASCLRGRQTTPGSEVNIGALTTVPLGQQYSADQQCRNGFGPTSRFCRGLYGSPTFNFDQDMCYNMRCQLPSSSSLCAGTLPFMGTSCGDGKWCVEGSCVNNPMAPRTPSPTCPQGDDPTFNCTQAFCQTERLRNFECCAFCSPPIPAPMSMYGVQTSTTTPIPRTSIVTSPGGAGRTQSIPGVTTATGGTSGTPSGPGRVSVFGVESTTTMEPDTSRHPTQSIDGVQPETGTPTPETSSTDRPQATLSIFGVQPDTATPTPTTDQPETTLSIPDTTTPSDTTTDQSGTTLSIFGVQPNTATLTATTTTTTDGVESTLSIFGIQPDTPTPTATTSTGQPTLSIAGVQSNTAMPTTTTPAAQTTLSLVGGQPDTVTPTTPTSQPGVTLSIAGGQPNTATPTTMQQPTLSIFGATPTTATTPADQPAPTLSIFGGQSDTATPSASTTSQPGTTLSINRMQSDTATPTSTPTSTSTSQPDSTISIARGQSGTSTTGPHISVADGTGGK